MKNETMEEGLYSAPYEKAGETEDNIGTSKVPGEDISETEDMTWIDDFVSGLKPEEVEYLKSKLTASPEMKDMKGEDMMKKMQEATTDESY